MVMLGRIFESEAQANGGEEGFCFDLLIIGAGIDFDPVVPSRQLGRAQVHDPPILIADARANAKPTIGALDFQPDGHADCWSSTGRVENVRGDAADAHNPTIGHVSDEAMMISSP